MTIKRKSIKNAKRDYENKVKKTLNIIIREKALKNER